MQQVCRDLTEELLSHGFVSVSPLDRQLAAEPGTRSPFWIRLWFAATDSGIPHMSAAVTLTLDRQVRGEVWIGGKAHLVSDAVEEALRVSEELDYNVGAFCGNQIDTIPFGYFDNRLDASRGYTVRGPATIGYAAAHFRRLLGGRVADWFAARDSIDKLFDLARTPYAMHLDKTNPDPMRLRAAVVLGVLANRADKSAELMDWYLSREQFHTYDSRTQAKAFDTTLGQQYADYARARKM
jgi:hypothetical protein